MVRPFGIAYADLPDTVPIFPLPGVLLLPGGQLPLNIFENRYLAMTADALGGDGLIGMIEPAEAHADPVPAAASLRPLGCLGRLISYAETRDGRMLITLQGVCRFRVAEELDVITGYRQVKPDCTGFDGDFDGISLGDEARGAFRHVLERYLQSAGIRTELDRLAALPGRELIATLGMSCPFGLPEKRALLAAPDFAEMKTILETLMEMAVQGADTAPGSDHPIN